MVIFDYSKPETFSNFIPLAMVPNTQYNIDYFLSKNININNRTFILTDDIKCILSDGQVIIIPKNFTTDLISVPRWIWSLLGPFDACLIGDLIHDYLYVIKIKQIEHFQSNIYQAQKFADSERNRWRNKITTHIPRNKLRIKNWITNKTLVLFAKDFYIRKYQIPD